MTERTLGFFGALGSLVRAKGRSERLSGPWRKTQVGASDSGLYATLACKEHGALHVRLRPNADPHLAPTIEVEWGRYNGNGPSAPIVIYAAQPPQEGTSL